jgi:type II secretory pathway pseudopilin PulG
MLRPSSSQPRRSAGFSLLEMSIVITIMVTVAAATVSTGSSIIEISRKASTNTKLDVIESTLMAFRLANNRLPCPGDLTLTDIPANAATYGYEANNTSGTCTGGSPAANFSATNTQNANIPAGTTVAEGAVPVRTLNLPDEFQWDGWGRKFGYAIWTPYAAAATSTASYPGFLVYGPAQNCGGMTVENAGHSSRTAATAYVLISYGPDGHGAYLKNGTQYLMGSDNADELTNCHCTSTAPNTATYTGTYVQEEPNQVSAADSLNVFDDIVRYKDRWQMQNSYDTYNPSNSFCNPGFHVTCNVASQAMGGAVGVGDVNGDGIPDLVIDAPSQGGAGGGKIYVIFGTKSGFPDPLPVSSLNGTNGFEIDAGCCGTYRLYVSKPSLAVADLNGDGYADIIVSGTYITTQSVFIIYGHSGSWTTPDQLPPGGSGTFHFSYIKGTNTAGSYTIAAGDVSGHNISGHKLNDLLIGYPNDATYGGSAGMATVIFAPSGGGYWPNYTLPPANGSTWGVNYYCGSFGCAGQFGSAVGIGDINGDGIGDLIIGTRYGVYTSTYVLFGKASGWPTSDTSLPALIDGTQGFSIQSNLMSRTTTSITTGDFNGDGITDFAFTLNGGYPWVVFGGKTGANNSTGTPWTSCTGSGCQTNAAFFNGTNGTKIQSVLATGMIAAGDVNGDGITDLIAGDSSNSHDVDVVFGKKSGWASTTFLNLDGITDSEFSGYNTYGMASTAGITTGDITGDGIPELIIGNTAANGTVSVYYGHKAGLPPWPAGTFSW